MSVSVALQDLALSLLRNSGEVTAIVGDRIVDGNADLAFPNITLGLSDFQPDDADCIKARQETLQIDCWTQEAGKKWPCRALVDAVKGALHDAEGELASGALVQIVVSLARIIDDPDGITMHGVVQITALIEE
ncbi:DUF3168 domain-containing protein [Neorhizobium sp. NCHU2750]|uniref:DUF3168 domain-containing protein n=1 Tax=Neorhizobium sp. NCHU2750 TaxID=1825976 RepID=UPI000E7665E9|nr:hypothetical protein NCHU2750_06270 [Neorhizobium sp. NCHU2750]